MSAVAPGPAAERVFSADDQIAFASLSGDSNPMHMDAQAARRTPAGAPVVHGVQSMLWALETLAQSLPLQRLSGLDADFARFLYVGERCALAVIRRTDTECRAELRVGESRISHYVLRLGGRAAPEAPTAALPVEAAVPLVYGVDQADPLPLSWEQIAVSAGRVAFFRPDDAASAAYPALSRAIGAGRVSALLSLTRLVGMVSPGLHSTFHKIAVSLVEDPAPADPVLFFHPEATDPRFSLVTLAVRAAGLAGRVRASRRSEPTRQPASAALRAMLPAGMLDDAPGLGGNLALVVGGSRGLGEVTGKLLGLLGVETILTYASGEADAESVAADIRAAGGRARTMRLDMLAELAPQLASLPRAPTSLYYFATPRIAGRAGSGYDPAAFQAFCRIYVDAFGALCTELAGRQTATLQVLYPSTVYVDQAPRNMTEYAMAKAAGEVLAANLTRHAARLHIDCVRLPRVATDQTAGMIESEMGSPVDCMIPIVRRVETLAASGSGPA